MAKKWYSAFSRFSGLKPPHQMVFCHMQDTRGGGPTPLQICSRCILQPQPSGLKDFYEVIYIYIYINMYIYISKFLWIQKHQIYAYTTYFYAQQNLFVHFQSKFPLSHVYFFFFHFSYHSQIEFIILALLFFCSEIIFKMTSILLTGKVLLVCPQQITRFGKITKFSTHLYKTQIKFFTLKKDMFLTVRWGL